jgi:hypothetical protein
MPITNIKTINAIITSNLLFQLKIHQYFLITSRHCSNRITVVKVGQASSLHKACMPVPQIT